MDHSLSVEQIMNTQWGKDVSKSITAVAPSIDLPEFFSGSLDIDFSLQQLKDIKKLLLKDGFKNFTVTGISRCTNVMREDLPTVYLGFDYSVESMAMYGNDDDGIKYI